MRPRVGISLCLLGEEVRYDGAHKRDRVITDELGEYFEWVPVCPEVDVGMGVPREPVQLLAEGDGVRLVGVHSGRDWTEEMSAYAETKVAELAAAGVDGFILKKDSPSCGTEQVQRFDAAGLPTRDGVGAFARVLMERLNTLPVEEEDRLADTAVRERFIARVSHHQRRRALRRDGLDV